MLGATTKSDKNWIRLCLIALGVVIGALGVRLYDTSDAQAQPPTQMRECMALSLHWHDGAAFREPRVAAGDDPDPVRLGPHRRRLRRPTPLRRRLSLTPRPGK